MDVRIAGENDKEKWNQFVDREGGSFHLYYDWKYYYENNPKKHRFIPLLIEDPTSDILGIFPIEENLVLFYGFLTSLPLGTLNGFLIKGNLSENGKKRVIQSFLDYIDANYSGSHSLFTIKEHFSFSEEPPNPTQILIDNGYEWLDNSVTGQPCTYILKLEEPFEQKIWMGRHFSKTFRNRIRLARKKGAEIIVDDDFIYLDDFGQMYIDMVTKFGLVIEKEDIDLQFNIFRKKIKLFVCLLKSKPISAIMCYYTPTIVHGSMGP